MELQITPNKQSRRNWLRDAAIAATSVAVVPSFFIGCTDHRIPPGVGIGNPADLLTQDELVKAAKNLKNMVDWLKDLHERKVRYQSDMLEYLKSGKEQPSGWLDFIINIFLDIAVGIMGAAAAVIEGATAGAATAGIVAALAIGTELVKKFIPTDLDPHNLDGVFADFAYTQDKLHYALIDALTVVADPGQDKTYKNLKDAFKGGGIDFNGKKYTLSDLSNSDFPTAINNGTLYTTTINAAVLQFQKYFWNVMIAKAGKMNIYRTGNNTACRYSHCKTAYEIVRNIYINEAARKGSYMRGYFQPEKFIVHNQEYVFAEFYFEFDGRRLPDAVAEILFIDTVRGNDINPNGLFHRDYVYKQFHLQKPDFQEFHELARSWDKENGAYEDNFDVADDNYEFTGGLLKILPKPK